MAKRFLIASDVIIGYLRGREQAIRYLEAHDEPIPPSISEEVVEVAV